MNILQMKLSIAIILSFIIIGSGYGFGLWFEPDHCLFFDENKHYWIPCYFDEEQDMWIGLNGELLN